MSVTDEVFHEKSASTRAALTHPSELQSCTLGVGDYLYREAGPRAFVYRVEKGVIVIFERQIGRPVRIIGIAGEGDYFGLGCLEHHRDNARAVVETVVSYVPKATFSLLAERDPRLRKKQADAIARDFKYGKLLACDRGRSTPIECVAAFLVALSRQNAEEGRDPSLVSNSRECVSATSLLLDMDAKAFERAFLRLRWMGLIEPCPAGLLRLKNISALEGVADGVLHHGTTDFNGVATPVAGGASNPARRPHLERLTACFSAQNTFRWKTEVLEAVWLATVTGSISAIAVGIAFIIINLAMQ